MVNGESHAVRPWMPLPARKLAFHAAIFLVGLLILFSRRPDAILNAQFWAEDGKYWYADAYQHSWHCLFFPWAGYLHTVPRLVGLLAQLVPLSLAPLVMNLSALVFEILPVNFFLSSRFDALSLHSRLLGALLYLSVPNSYEIHANTTNIQWHLALLGCMVLLAQPALSRPWLIFDLGVLVLASFDSPLGLPLILVASALWWLRRDGRAVAALIALIPGGAVQMAFMLLSHSRKSAANGATLARLAGILGGQIFFSSVLGMMPLLRFFLFGEKPVLLVAETVAMIVGLAVVFYAAFRAPLQLRLFLLFAVAVLILVLQQPFVDPNSSQPQWELLQFPGLGNRYYFYPMLAFLGCVLWMAGVFTPTPKAVRYAALPILLLLPFGIYQDWGYPRYKDLHFQEFAAQFEHAAPGTTVTIPVNPTGWRMELVKK